MGVRLTSFEERAAGVLSLRQLGIVVALAVASTACGGAEVGDTNPPHSEAAGPGSTGSTSGEPTPRPSATAAEAGAFEVVVAGVTIAGHCLGERARGEPAILLLHGLGSNQRYFGPSFEESLAERSMVCGYDRPSAGGASEAAAERPRTVDEVADEARQLLTELDIDPPYFFIGHSAGAAIALVGAHRYPDDLAGVVALNPLPPFTAWKASNEAAVPPPGANVLTVDFYQGANEEGIDFVGTDVMSEPLPDDLPFAVVFGEDRACGGLLEYCDQAYPLWMAIQQDVANTGAQGTFVQAEGSGHDVLLDARDVVVSTIDAVWAAATE